jgi:hypothetical protein
MDRYRRRRWWAGGNTLTHGLYSTGGARGNGRVVGSTCTGETPQNGSGPAKGAGPGGTLGTTWSSGQGGKASNGRTNGGGGGGGGGGYAGGGAGGSSNDGANGAAAQVAAASSSTTASLRVAGTARDGSITVQPVLASEFAVAFVWFGWAGSAEGQPVGFSDQELSRSFRRAPGSNPAAFRIQNATSTNCATAASSAILSHASLFPGETGSDAQWRQPSPVGNQGHLQLQNAGTGLVATDLGGGSLHLAPAAADDVTQWWLLLRVADSVWATPGAANALAQPGIGDEDPDNGGVPDGTTTPTVPNPDNDQGVPSDPRTEGENPALAYTGSSTSGGVLLLALLALMGGAALLVKQSRRTWRRRL